MLCCALLVSSFSGLLTVSAATPTEFILGLFDAKVFTSSDGLKLNYRIYVPDDYNPDKTYPLILFMHGAG